MIRSVLFVCAGNICRSPIAEGAFRRLVEARPALAGIDVGSAGTIAYHGQGAAPDAIAAARDEFGIDLTRHRSRHADALDADLILALDRSVLRDLERMKKRGRVELLGDYAGTGDPVFDPYGCERDDYDICAKHIRTLVELAADRIEEELTGESV
jgi:protein-tyrosine phosphatase